MTFPTELERLLREVRADTGVQARYLARIRLEQILWDNAPAILGLVRAAEHVAAYPDADKYLGTQTFNPFAEALAKLNGEGK